MFTGIIEDIGIIDSIENTDFGKTFTIKLENIDLSEIKIGDSIAMNGVCLTVISKSKKMLSFDIVEETLKCTNLGRLLKGHIVNIERAMIALGGRFDGHILQGHVETTGKLFNIKKISDSLIITIQIDENYLKYCILKGSIAINGISLTIADIKDDMILIAIIPHTNKYTNICELEIGDEVNIETDLVAKYIENLFDLKKNEQYLKYYKLEDKN